MDSRRVRRHGNAHRVAERRHDVDVLGELVGNTHNRTSGTDDAITA